MEYYDLSDESADQAWEEFLKLEKQWRNDRSSKEKYLEARQAFKKYDSLTVKFINMPDE